MGINGFLLFGVALIALAVWGALRQPTTVGYLLAAQVALAGLLLSATALWHFVASYRSAGLVLALVVLAVAALSASVGASLLLGHRRGKRARRARGA